MLLFELYLDEQEYYDELLIMLLDEKVNFEKWL
jgi:hypothetical protein